ncbi:MAG: GTP-binding protein [Pseudomonadota bacterium]
MDTDHRIPITALCGFLGSGKTTLLRRWRREAALDDAAVIVHDLSEFGLDAELLAGEESVPVPGRLEGRVAALHGRHAREQLHASLARALSEIAALDPPAPVVLCESTGAARPWPLILALVQDARFFLRHFIVTVDALNLHRDFADGQHFLESAPPVEDVALRHAGSVLAEQLRFANVIVLTKVDTVSEATVDAQVRCLQTLRPDAAIGLSAHAGLLLPQLDDTPAPALGTLRKRAEHHDLTLSGSTADQLEAVVLRDPRPFHPQRLFDACQTHLGTGLYRTKGFLWLASRPADVLLWQQSGSQIALEKTGIWRAEVAENHDGELLPEEVSQLRAQLDDEHPVFGDRHTELTLIGLAADREAFLSVLRAALCTEAEVAAWQQGVGFPDPWPKTVRRVE